jgi:hypothetical protein
LDGSIKCPHKCDAPPYSDIDVARHVTESTFQGYLEVKMCVVERAVHDQAQTDLMATASTANLASTTFRSPANGFRIK